MTCLSLDKKEAKMLLLVASSTGCIFVSMTKANMSEYLCNGCGSLSSVCWVDKGQVPRSGIWLQLVLFPNDSMSEELKCFIQVFENLNKAIMILIKSGYVFESNTHFYYSIKYWRNW